jgi:hypothetical protein
MLHDFMSDCNFIAFAEDSDGGRLSMSPEIKAAIDATGKHTSMGVTQFDLRLLDVAKVHVGRDTDSYREFLQWLLATHPGLDSEALGNDAVATFEDEIEGTVSA